MLFRMTKSELYRASRMKCTYIIPIIMVAIVMLLCFMYMRLDSEQLGLGESVFSNYIEDEDEREEAMKNDLTNIVTTDEEEARSGSLIGEGIIYDWKVDNVFNIFTSAADILLLLSIFVGIFIGMLHSTGTDKNMLIASGNRNVLFGARAITIGLYSLMFELLILLSTIVGIAIFGKSVSFDDPVRLIKYTAVSWIMVFTFSMLIMLIGNLVRSQAAAITIGIILAYGVLNMILMLVDILIRKIFGVDDFALSEYTITGRIQSFRVFSSTGYITKSLIVCGVVLAIITAIQVNINRKRDLC